MLHYPDVKLKKKHIILTSSHYTLSLIKIREFHSGRGISQGLTTIFYYLE